METTPTNFADPSVYLWNISNNGELKKVEGFSAPPPRRTAHCADYATIRQQVGPSYATVGILKAPPAVRLHLSGFNPDSSSVLSGGPNPGDRREPLPFLPQLVSLGAHG